MAGSRSQSKGQPMSTLTTITQNIITANDNRLNQVISRHQHARIIAAYNRALVANGYTWADVENESNRLQGQPQ
jgi:hypothetical protein